MEVQKPNQLSISEKESGSPLKPITVFFHRIHWSYIIGAILFLFLPLYNYPFTSRYSDGYIFQFFWDPTLSARLETDRNLMELGLPLHIYNFIGILPGFMGLGLLIYFILSASPHILRLDRDQVRFWESKVLIPIRTRIPADAFDSNKKWMLDLGRPKMSIFAWIFVMFSAFWGFGAVWTYAFDSVKNSGIFYFFEIYQTIWNGTTAIGTFNVGEHLLVTTLIMVGAPMLMTIFPRRLCAIETEELRIQFAYSFFHIRMTDQGELAKLNPSILEIYQKFQSLKALSFLPKEEKQTLNTQIEPRTYIPSFKLTIIGAALICLLLIQYLPRFFIGDFFFPFLMLGWTEIFFLFMRVVFYEWWTKQTVQSGSNKMAVLRHNPISGHSLFVLNKPEPITPVMQQTYPAGFESFPATFLLFEIGIGLGVILAFPVESFTNGWTYLRLLVYAIFVWAILLGAFNWRPVLLFSQDRTDRIDHSALVFPKAQDTFSVQFHEWATKIRAIRKTPQWFKQYSQSLRLFIFPLALLAVWLILFLANTWRFWVYIFL